MSEQALRGTAAAALASCVLLAAALPAAANTPYSGLYVFGDSLSDSGNLFALIAYPPSPYWNGHFSNGKVAAEYLAGDLGIGVAGFHDLAYGGATSGADGQVPGTGLLSQVGGYTAALGGGAADGHALYMVWAGANDFLHGDLSQVSTIVSTAIGNLTTAVSALHAKGATNFLLPTLPDLGATPRALALDVAHPGQNVALTLSGISGYFNTQLVAAYGALANSWTDEHFYVFDTFSAQHLTLTQAAQAGKVTTLPCFDGASLCADASNFYYFDDIHPSTTTHQALAGLMAAAVPEPQTYALWLGGLALLAAWRRRPHA